MIPIVTCACLNFNRVIYILLFVGCIFIQPVRAQIEQQTNKSDLAISENLSNYNKQLQEAWSGNYKSSVAKARPIEIVYSVDYVSSVRYAKVVVSSGIPALDNQALKIVINLRPINNFYGGELSSYKLCSKFSGKEVTTRLIKIEIGGGWSAPGDHDARAYAYPVQ